MEEETTRRRTGVDRVRQAFELNALLLKLPDQIDKMLNTTAKPIQFADHEGVSVTQAVTSLRETGTFRSAPTHPVFEDLLAACVLESFGLELQVLVLRRDASIADSNPFTS